MHNNLLIGSAEVLFSQIVNEKKLVINIKSEEKKTVSG